MKLALVRACTRSACFELQNNTCYTAPAPFRVQLNGQIVLEACCTNVFSVFSLEPGKTYVVRAGTWHSTVTAPGCKILIVENVDTGDANTVKYKIPLGSLPE